MLSDDKSSRCLWQGELKKKKTKLTLENTEGAIKMDNPEKLATYYGTQNEEKQNKNTTQ